jgi:uncharacterized protein YjbJ (UPF0337 family)
MDKDIIKGRWKEIKGKLRQKWGEVTDDDLSKMQGSYEELSGHLQKKYGYDKDRAKKEIDNFVKENKLDKED